mgnify:CR=1 FL=1
MNKELLAPSLAGEVLYEMLPDRSAKQWTLWLQNNRNQVRKAAYRVPFERISNGAFYRREDLAKFVEWEKGRQLGSVKVTGRAAEVMRAFGIGEVSGGVHGRKLSCTANALPGEGGTSPYGQLIIDDPLLVFRLDRDELARLAQELVQAVKRIDQMRAAT